jgi:hypothetical protein
MVLSCRDEGSNNAVSSVQAGFITDYCQKKPKPTRGQREVATELLTRAMLQHHVAPWFLTSNAFKAYIAFISGERYEAPTRYQFLQMTDTLSHRSSKFIAKELNDAIFFSFEEDSWTSHNKHYHAITTGKQGTSYFVGTFEITKGPESAENQAKAVHATLLSAMGLDPALHPDDTSIPHGTVAAMTSDTTNVMPATAKELARYPLCHGLFWVPCAAHELGLFLKDQTNVPEIKMFLRQAGRIASIFKSGAPNKLLSSCALTIALQ